MLVGGLLFRVLVGAVVGAVATETVHRVYKILTKDTIKVDTKKKIPDEIPDVLKDELYAKIVEKQKKGEVHKAEDLLKLDAGVTAVVDVIDKKGNTIIGGIKITGDEFGEDLNKGDVIPL